MHTYTGAKRARRVAGAWWGGEGLGQRRRENMVGVSMVLAEFVKFKHGLYKSCGVECFEGMRRHGFS